MDWTEAAVYICFISTAGIVGLVYVFAKFANKS